MSSERLRVLASALGAVALIVASTFVVDWFEVTGARALGVKSIGIDLRGIHACGIDGVCASIDMSSLKGFYPTLATVTLWVSLGLAGLVALQAGLRLATGSAVEALSKRAYLAGIAAALLAFATGYLFGPEQGAFAATPFGVTVNVARTWTPLLLILGDGVAVVALYYAVNHATSDAIPLAEARVVSESARPVAPTSMPVPIARAEVPVPLPRTVTPGSRPIPTIPEACRGQVMYTAMTAELTRGGVDARREDGEAPLVMWRDVVGAVARRLPPELGGATFVDLVSNAGATVRILPWTRLTGERPPPPRDDADADADAGDGEARARALLELIVAHCPAAKLDRATRAFVDGGAKAPQLPDRAMLAEHDARLA